MLTQKQVFQPRTTHHPSNLQQQLQQTAQQLSNAVLNSPAFIYLLSTLPDIFIIKVVSFTKLHSYIYQYKCILLSNPQYFKHLIILYRRKLINVYDQQDLLHNTQNMFDDMKFIQNNLPLSYQPTIGNQFIRLQIASNQFGMKYFQNFPQFLITFSQLQFDVFFQCILHFIKCKSPYQFTLHVQNQLMNAINIYLNKFYQQFEGRQTDYEVQNLKNIINKILYYYLQTKQQDNLFVETILNKLMIKQQFCIIFFQIMKKYGFLSINYRNWIQIIINLGHHKFAIRLVQYTLCYFTNVVNQLDILQLIQHNQYWAQQWVTYLFDNKAQMVPSMFLYGQPHYFIIINKLLMYFKFTNQDQFYSKLEQIQYFFCASKLYYHQEAKKSMTQMFCLFVGLDQFDYLFQDLNL